MVSVPAGNEQGAVCRKVPQDIAALPVLNHNCGSYKNKLLVLRENDELHKYQILVGCFISKLEINATELVSKILCEKLLEMILRVLNMIATCEQGFCTCRK